MNDHKSQDVDPMLSMIVNALLSMATSLSNIDARLALMCDDTPPEDEPELDLDGNVGGRPRDESQGL